MFLIVQYCHGTDTDMITPDPNHVPPAEATDFQ